MTQTLTKKPRTAREIPSLGRIRPLARIDGPARPRILAALAGQTLNLHELVTETRLHDRHVHRTLALMLADELVRVVQTRRRHEEQPSVRYVLTDAGVDAIIRHISR